MNVMDAITSGLKMLTGVGAGPEAAPPTRAQQQLPPEAHHVIADPAAAEARRQSAAENLQAVPQANSQVEQKVDALTAKVDGLINMLDTVFASFAPILSMLGLGTSEPNVAKSAAQASGQASPAAQTTSAKADEIDKVLSDMLELNARLPQFKSNTQPTPAELAAGEKALPDVLALAQRLQGLGGADSETQQAAASTAKPQLVVETKPQPQPNSTTTGQQQDEMLNFLSKLGLGDSKASVGK